MVNQVGFGSPHIFCLSRRAACLHTYFRKIGGLLLATTFRWALVRHNVLVGSWSPQHLGGLLLATMGRWASARHTYLGKLLGLLLTMVLNVYSVRSHYISSRQPELIRAPFGPGVDGGYDRAELLPQVRILPSVALAQGFVQKG